MFAGTTTQEAASTDTRSHTEVRITPFGTVTIEGRNYTGDACSLLGNKLREALGGGDTDLKPEFFQTTVEDTTVTNW